MPRHELSQHELQLLKQVLNTDRITANIRLRKGEYQYSLAEAIASFQLELHLPNVKEIITKLFGEERSSDVQFTRKIQTILKKMERGNVVKILPKRKPWELQRYMLLSFKFQDVDKNIVNFATENQINQAREMLNKMLIEQDKIKPRKWSVNIKIFTSLLVLIISYGVIVWDLLRPVIDPLIFVVALFTATASSLFLGKALA